MPRSRFLAPGAYQQSWPCRATTLAVPHAMGASYTRNLRGVHRSLHLPLTCSGSASSGDVSLIHRYGPGVHVGPQFTFMRYRYPEPAAARAGTMAFAQTVHVPLRIYRQPTFLTGRPPYCLRQFLVGSGGNHGKPVRRSRSYFRSFWVAWVEFHDWVVCFAYDADTFGRNVDVDGYCSRLFPPATDVCGGDFPGSCASRNAVVRSWSYSLPSMSA